MAEKKKTAAKKKTSSKKGATKTPAEPKAGSKGAGSKGVGSKGAEPKSTEPKGAEPKGAGSKGAGSKGVEPKKAEPKKTEPKGGEPTFPEALAALLRRRKLKVPAGLKNAPPDAYARQSAAFVATLAELDDDRLAAQAEKIASHAKRQAERVRKTWDDSALLREIRRRKLKAPDPPQRVVGAAFSFKKPLPEWTDAELLDAARQWSERGRA